MELKAMSAKKKARKVSTAKVGRNYQPKVALPLPFDQAIEGLLAVKPEKRETDDKAK
jgi:hypothetical protein